MRKLAAPSLLLAGAIWIASSQFAASQNPGMAMGMAKSTLLVALLDARQVVGGSSSSGTGTGTFLLDPARHSMEYRLTYQGLVSGNAKSIGLYNFGQGKNGEPIKLLCGADSQPCPNGNSATISGRFERGDSRALDNALIREFDTARVYVEIVGADGKPEIRGQLGPNTAMVPYTNFLANLAPAQGAESKGSGTAIFSETSLPGGKTSVFYAATVAGTSGAPTNIALVGGAEPAARKFTRQLALPQLTLSPSSDRTTGGSLRGLYQTNRAAPNALLATTLMSKGGGQPGIVITTTRFPNGELYGALIPVR